MPLTDLVCRTTKPEPRLKKLSDGGGLQLWVQPNGAKLWRFAYRFGGKQKLLALGSYPLVTLADARTARDNAKRLLLSGADPSEARKEQRAEQALNKDTFAALTDDLIAKLRKEKRTEKTIAKVKWLLDFALPTLGHRAITSIRPVEILAVLQSLEKRGRFHSAHRLRSTISAAFRIAIASDRTETDPTAALRDALVSYQEKPRPAITEKKPFGALLRAIHHYDGQPVTRLALELQANIFSRPGELRQAEWTEFDFDERIWNVPGERMKGRMPHFVPLSRQAIALLEQLRELTGNRRLLFPGIGNPNRCISDATLNAALRRLGYDTKTEHCAHGFRSSASTLLNESKKFHADAIERQLAHLDEDDVRRKYARGRFWDERVEMMQFWSDYCDEMRGSAAVIRLVKV